jgi:hypothetical protein
MIAVVILALLLVPLFFVSVQRVLAGDREKEEETFAEPHTPLVVTAKAGDQYSRGAGFESRGRGVWDHPPEPVIGRAVARPVGG